MRLDFRRFYGIDNSQYLVEAAVSRYSAIKYASEIEDEVSSFAEVIAELRCLRANIANISINELESLGYERYDDKTLLEVIEYLFRFEDESCDDNHLNDQDYINIANSRFPNEFDKCVILKSSFVSKYLMQEGTGKDFSYWTEFYKYRFKVVVRKKVQLNETKEYSLEELDSLVKSRDVLIVACYSYETYDARDRKKEVISGEQLSKLHCKEWLQYVQQSDNPFHSFYIAYLKQFITEELINESINFCCCECKKLFEYPEDKLIMKELKYDDYNDKEVFEGMNANQRLSFVKQYEKSNDLINKARTIIENYSDEYKMYFA